jgi:hypothetical protein
VIFITEVRQINVSANALAVGPGRRKAGCREEAAFATDCNRHEQTSFSPKGPYTGHSVPGVLLWLLHMVNLF